MAAGEWRRSTEVTPILSDSTVPHGEFAILSLCFGYVILFVNRAISCFLVPGPHMRKNDFWIFQITEQYTLCLVVRALSVNGCNPCENGLFGIVSSLVTLENYSSATSLSTYSQICLNPHNIRGRIWRKFCGHSWLTWFNIWKVFATTFSKHETFLWSMMPMLTDAYVYMNSMS